MERNRQTLKNKDQINSLVLNRNEKKILNVIQESLNDCKSFCFNVAFITFEGLQLLINQLDDLKENGIKGKIITSTYLSFTDPKAIKRLMEYENIEIRLHEEKSEKKGLHSKGYIFEYDDYYKIIIGSANMTGSAFKSNVEWNIQVVSKKNDRFACEVLNEFNSLWESLNPITDFDIDVYEKFLKDIKSYRRELEKRIKQQGYDLNGIAPNQMQLDAVASLNRLRENGESKAMVIAATATGKTYMSAFDVKSFKPNKCLFVCHQEMILNKAKESFENVLGKDIDASLFTGNRNARDYNSQFIFATNISLANNIEMFDQDEFDYIIIDEAHHVAGETYQKIINYFKPRFLLGMTATPERCDGANIFDYFDNNVALEVRLNDALLQELVVPFHYFGVTDVKEVDLEGVDLNNLDVVADKLMINRRVDYIIDQMNKQGHDGNKLKCLGFCVNQKHAKFMEEEFSKRGIESKALTDKDNEKVREEYAKRLEDDNDKLSVIFAVNIFNEGVDIPSINTVLMLRPTHSPIIFIQQLGRGLRKCDGKSFLTVIDFIANYDRAFLIAVALKGSRYYDKDSLLVSVKNDFADIPGDTFVTIDEIAKERILNLVCNENFYSMAYLKEEYNEFKIARAGKTPEFLMDYIADGAPNPLKFVSVKKNYLSFLNSVEKDEKYNVINKDNDLFNILKELSDMLPLKRPYEFAILKEIIAKKKLSKKDLGYICSKYVENPDENAISHSCGFLELSLFDDSAKKKMIKLIDVDEDSVSINTDFNKLVTNQFYKKYILDTIEYGLIKYLNDFGTKNYGYPFLKYGEQYSIQEVAHMFNCENVLSSYRGQGVYRNGKDYYLFVNLDKDNFKESIKFKDFLIDNRHMQWQSQNTTKQDSNIGKDLIYSEERGVTLHMFIRKMEKIDNQTLGHYYLGKVVNRGEVVGNKPITFKYLEFERTISDDIYEELTTIVKSKNQSLN